MGAENLSDVKSIATFALIFFWYIISVLASVAGYRPQQHSGPCYPPQLQPGTGYLPQQQPGTGYSPQHPGSTGYPTQQNARYPPAYPGVENVPYPHQQ